MDKPATVDPAIGKVIADMSPWAIAMIAVLLGFLAWRDWQISRSTPDDQARMPFSAKFALMILGGLVFVWMINSIFANTSKGTGFATVAGLILLGVATVIGIMNVLSLSAAKIGMLDGRQPFGLPEGSVRAILTMAFIVLVGVLSSYLLTGSQSRSQYQGDGMVTGVAASQAAASQSADAMRVLYGAGALVEIRKVDSAVPESFELVVHPKVDFTVADDIAKQTLTMISTILAAMIGFYFAARAGNDGADPAVMRRAIAQAELSRLVSTVEAETGLNAARAALAQLKAKVEANTDAKQRQAGFDQVKTAEGRLAELQRGWEEARTALTDPNATYAELALSADKMRALNSALSGLGETLKRAELQIGP
jgi:hypothetical protein